MADASVGNEELVAEILAFATQARANPDDSPGLETTLSGAHGPRWTVVLNPDIGGLVLSLEAPATGLDEDRRFALPLEALLLTFETRTADGVVANAADGRKIQLSRVLTPDDFDQPHVLRVVEDLERRCHELTAGPSSGETDPMPLDPGAGFIRV